MMQQYLLMGAGIVLAYLLGSISTSVWVGKAFFGVDVREKGSGNAGATNTFRVLGAKAGVSVMIIDVLKAWVAVQLAPFFAGELLTTDQLILYKIALGAVAVLGHVFPVYTGFRGGKGVASLVGVILSLYPQVFLAIFGCFLVVFLITRYVSLGSIIGAVLFPVFVIFIFHEESTALIVLSLLIAIFIPLTHHKNIKRLLKGEENKLKFSRHPREKS